MYLQYLTGSRLQTRYRKMAVKKRRIFILRLCQPFLVQCYHLLFCVISFPSVALSINSTTLPQPIYQYQMPPTTTVRGTDFPYDINPSLEISFLSSSDYYCLSELLINKLPSADMVHVLITAPSWTRGAYRIVQRDRCHAYRCLLSQLLPVEKRQFVVECVDGAFGLGLADVWKGWVNGVELGLSSPGISASCFWAGMSLFLCVASFFCVCVQSRV